MWETARRIGREFWLPLLAAVAWMAFDLWPWAGVELRTAIPKFMTAFFLAAWATGQWVRVSRQAKVEGSLAEVLRQLEATAKRLSDTMTGGDAFAFVYMDLTSPSPARITVRQFGAFPLAGVDVAMWRLPPSTSPEMRGPFRRVKVGELAVGQTYANPFDIVHLSGESYDFQVTFQARNGMWIQELYLRRIGDQWEQASVTFRLNGTIALVEAPGAFPTTGNPHIDQSVAAAAAPQS